MMRDKSRQHLTGETMAPHLSVGELLGGACAVEPFATAWRLAQPGSFAQAVSA